MRAEFEALYPASPPSAAAAPDPAAGSGAFLRESVARTSATESGSRQASSLADVVVARDDDPMLHVIAVAGAALDHRAIRVLSDSIAELDEVMAELTRWESADRPVDAGAALERLRRTHASLDPETLSRLVFLSARRAGDEKSTGAQGAASLDEWRLWAQMKSGGRHTDGDAH